MREPLYRGGFTTRATARILWRLLVRGIVPGGPKRWRAFARSLPWHSPADIAWVIADWIIALSMADFVRRRFAPPADRGGVERCLGAVRAALARYVEAGRAGLHVDHLPVPAVSLTLCGLLDCRFFRRAAGPLDRLLARTPTILTLHIEALREAERTHLQRLLHRLRRYGDRVSIVVDERLCPHVAIDSSVFNLVLDGTGANPQR